MAPSKKSKQKKTSHVNGVSPLKDGGSTSRSSQRKRKLSDMLGPQWSTEELERFYEAYRKYGKDWKKVAAFVRSRSVEMVEALYTMNRAYLSLPEGIASVVGLIAMMTDHYGVMEGSDSEQESNEGIGTSRKPQKRARVKSLDNSSRGLEGLSDRLQFKSSAGCLSLFKKKRTGNVPRAVGKRTPRIPVSFSHDKDNSERYFSPVKKGVRVKVDDDDVAHEIALALTEASQRGGSPQVSQTPKRKAKICSPDKRGGRMHAESDMTIAKLRDCEMDEDGCEISLGSTEADNGDYSGVKNYLTRADASSIMEVQPRGKRYHRRKTDIEESINHQMDEVKEACSGTEEEQKLGSAKSKYESEAVDGKSSKLTYKSSRKKSKKVLFGEDEGIAFDALQTLANLSLMMPETATDTESSVQVREEKAGNSDESKLKGSHPVAGVKTGVVKASKQRKFVSHGVDTTEAEGTSLNGSTMRKRRHKSSPVKVPKDDAPTSSHFAESPSVEKLVGKGKHLHIVSPTNEGKSIRPHEHTSTRHDIIEGDDSAPSPGQVVSPNQVNLPTKVRSKRKIGTPKQLTKEDSSCSENLANGILDLQIPSLNEKALNLKEKLSHCLSRHQARGWCVFEWFYSAIDYPWFAKQEFLEYLDHVGLGHVPRLTRVEWGVIRSSLGKPRRFSRQFLKEEKEKLNLYRESVRKHYAELHAGTREGLPTDLARPLKVGQKVIALHPKTREIHDGSVLTVDHSRYRVQFDQPELGVEFLEDIDCMPLNPLENLPASLARQYVTFSHYIENLGELKMHEQERESIPEGYLKLSLCETFESTSSPHISPPDYHDSNSLEQQKADVLGLNSQAKVGFCGAVNLQQVMNLQPSSFAQIQAREADAQALSELTRALDKKELVVSELKRMNDEVLENEKDRHNILRNSEPFKKQYAAILIQLTEINEQVSSALSHLRQRNTYQGNPSYVWLRPMEGSVDPACHDSCFDNSVPHAPEYGSHVSEIVESSRTRAQKMVDKAVQAVVSLKKERNNIESIEEAIDFVNNQLSADSTPPHSVQQTPVTQDQPIACESNPPAPVDSVDPQSNLPDQNEAQIPSELIARCVSTLLMIQKCTERQFPPGDVAQVLDSAVASLQPCCSQNLPIYAEIQKCMGIIRNQILALVPT